MQVCLELGPFFATAALLPEKHDTTTMQGIRPVPSCKAAAVPWPLQSLHCLLLALCHTSLQDVKLRPRKITYCIWKWLTIHSVEMADICHVFNCGRLAGLVFWDINVLLTIDMCHSSFNWSFPSKSALRFNKSLQSSALWHSLCNRQWYNWIH